MPVRVPSYSRLRFGTMVADNGIEFWDVLDLPTILEQPDDIIHTVTSADRIDLLSYRYYKDARLWWVIAVANDMEDIPAQFNVGDELRIPAPRYVTQVLFKKAVMQSRV